jgi:hypothetical protein
LTRRQTLTRTWFVNRPTLTTRSIIILVEEGEHHGTSLEGIGVTDHRGEGRVGSSPRCAQADWSEQSNSGGDVGRRSGGGRT